MGLYPIFENDIVCRKSGEISLSLKNYDTVCLLSDSALIEK